MPLFDALFYRTHHLRYLKDALVTDWFRIQILQSLRYAHAGLSCYRADVSESILFFN